MGMVIWGNVAWHPAAEAWRKAAPSAPTPDTVEVLRRRNGTGVYRLSGEGAHGAIIARRARLPWARVVRTMYERVLPHLPIAAARFRAFREERPGFAWVFLEEVGGRRE